MKMQNSFNALDDYLLRNSNKGDGGFLLKSHDKFSSQGISPIKAGIGGTTMKNHDELVIPTHQKGRNKPGALSEFLDESAFGDLNGKLPDHLSDEDMKTAAPLIPIFGEEIVKMLYSYDWHVREHGLQKIEEELTLGANSKILGSQDQN